MYLCIKTEVVIDEGGKSCHVLNQTYKLSNLLCWVKITCHWFYKHGCLLSHYKCAQP